jgi:segregation and condensation protein B
MSLKAKLEAVIYAAEEPVTLNQLALLFADEALEWRAERDKVAAEAEASAPASAAEPQPLLTEAFDYLELEHGAEPAEAPAPEAAAEIPIDISSSTNAEASQTDAQIQTQAENEHTAEELPASESPEVNPDEAARQAERQRDREARQVIRELLDELIQDYAIDGSGIEIREIAGGYRMATKAEYHDAVRAFVKSLKPAMKLSLPALETLAVIAYKQPVTAPEVNEIRGVESSGVFGSLLARKLIATAGRKPVVGRPILYKTTKEFLLRFGLKDLAELPSMEEFEKMAASEFEETELETANELESENEPESANETGAAEAEQEAAPATEEVIAESPKDHPGVG